MSRWSFALLLACFVTSGCHRRDLSPLETVKEYEDDIRHGNVGGAKGLLTAERGKELNDLALSVLAEEHNRQEEGVVSERRSAEMTGTSAKVIAVYGMKNRVRRTYTWELVREQGRWRINGWEVELKTPPLKLSS